MDRTDRQWAINEPLFEEKGRPDGRGRPWREARAVLNGVLWVLRTGAPWHDLPDRYPAYQTCHRTGEGPGSCRLWAARSQRAPDCLEFRRIRPRARPSIPPPSRSSVKGSGTGSGVVYDTSARPTVKPFHPSSFWVRQVSELKVPRS